MTSPTSKKAELIGVVDLKVHLVGKSTEKELISLEDLANLASGINGIANHIIKNRMGKARRTEGMKEVCSLGLSAIQSGSVTLVIRAAPDGQTKLTLDVGEVMSQVIDTLNEVDSGKFDNVDPRILPHIDLLTKPLSTPNAKLDLNLCQDNKVLAKSKVLTSNTRKRVSEALRTYKIQSGTISGRLIEINLKTYSFQIQTLISQEKIRFDPNQADSVRSFLGKTVEVSFERESVSSKERRLLEIKEAGLSMSKKKEMTAKDFLESGLIGKLSHRKDIHDSVEYSRMLRDEVFR
ncbi:MAG TPA: hypothetical protein VJJ82_05190 [Candidatus Nanoarchaeia archaeon]|nr:hypothetical protein [Candidatus Nanoarchaeia archaeon]